MSDTSGDVVTIFDTTLRDGEQAPGCSMNRDTKLLLAAQLRLLGVDVVEAGFPAASPHESDAVAAVAESVGGPGGPVICGLARANHRDIEICAKAVSRASVSRIHIFLATSLIHMQHKLKMSAAEVMRVGVDAVGYASSLCGQVEFSAEDAGRSDFGFLTEIFTAVAEAGATTLNIPDTVGYTNPEEYSSLVAHVARTVPRGPHVVLSAHCHDDLGLAVANSLAGISAGARQVECTILGIGERAGNASLEEVVMALKTRRDHFGLRTSIVTERLMRTSQMVADAIGMTIPANKAVIGANAFAHEAGIHQDGMLKNRATYEIMTAESVGRVGAMLVLGKHSGRNALRARIATHFGVVLRDDELAIAFQAFKRIADDRREVMDADLAVLLRESLGMQVGPREKRPVAPITAQQSPDVD